MHCTSSHNQKKDNLKTKSNQLTENQTVWKSDNQRDKEETFIQTGKRGRDRQLGGEDSQQGGSWQTQQGGGLWRGWAKLQLAVEAAAGGPGDRPSNPEFQHREIKPQTTD